MGQQHSTTTAPSKSTSTLSLPSSTSSSHEPHSDSASSSSSAGGGEQDEQQQPQQQNELEQAELIITNEGPLQRITTVQRVLLFAVISVERGRELACVNQAFAETLQTHEYCGPIIIRLRRIGRDTPKRKKSQHSQLLPPPLQTRHQFQTGLFECALHPASCLEGVLCSCCQVSRQHNAIRGEIDRMTCNRCCGVPLCYPCFVHDIREWTKSKFVIDEPMLLTCAAACCCLPCSLAQTHRELAVRGLNPGGFFVKEPFCRQMI